MRTGSTFVKIIILAGLYILTGKLGLLLAVPPGYATIIWPASGIAIGMLLAHGPRLWPGILLGSFLLNGFNSDVLSWTAGVDPGPALTTFVIALGSTLQALAGYGLVRRALGLPLAFTHVRQVAAMFVLTGPLACVIAPTIGVAALHFSGVLPSASVVGNWLTWWAGDLLGVLVFLPLALMAPGAPQRMIWRGSPLGGLSAVAVLALIVPLGLTFYSWKITSENAYEQSRTRFEALAAENEEALQFRMRSYDHALLGAAAFVHGSDTVSRASWRAYVTTVGIEKDFPGINGIGLIRPVPQADTNRFLDEVRADGAPDFEISPAAPGRPQYIITYIEPIDANRPALGLNIGFEDNRVEAAERSRDSGEPVITRKIILVQDEKKTPGFLLLHPVYRQGVKPATPEERRQAFTGWVYAPFVANNLLEGLTRSQGYKLNLKLYDGGVEAPDNLIYDSAPPGSTAQPAFVVRKRLNVMQQEWLAVWTSTPSYEQSQSSEQPFFVLIGGLAFTGLFGLFLMMAAVRRTETIEWMVKEQKYALPITIFMIVAVGSLYLFYETKRREEMFAQNIIADQAEKIQLLITTNTSEKLLAVRRLGQRWNAADGTPEKEWRADAANYISQITGLRTLEWVGADYRVRWAAPREGNERAIGLNILAGAERRAALEGAADKDTLTVTPPLDLVQGYRAFIAYAPVQRNGRFDGFMAAIFSSDIFFKQLLTREMSDQFEITLDYQGKRFFVSAPPDLELDTRLVSERDILIYDKTWRLRVTPTRALVRSQLSSLPLVVLITGLLIGGLLAMTVRAIMLSRVKSAYLAESEETFRTAMVHAPIGMGLVSPKGKWLKVSPSLCALFGYDEETMLQTDIRDLTHPDDLENSLEMARQCLEGERDSYQVEKRYFHSSGKTIWALLHVSAVRGDTGKPKYVIIQIQDITQQKEVEQLKNEFVSVVSHELRTPLTSIRGSLGLMAGSMAKDLPATASRLINIAYQNCERLILLINDILDIDKIASGQMRFNVAPRHVSMLVEQAVEANVAFAERFGVTFRIDQVDDAAEIDVDEDRMIQVLSNLLSNAAKFSPEGAAVTVSAISQNDRVRILVADKGPGIAEEFQDRIFGKFSQADSSMTRAKGGTGLGLHISKQIVEQMGGTIGFDSIPGQGSTFWVEFAAHVDGVGEGLQSVGPEESLPRVLHVEDDRDLADVIAAALQGRAVVTAARTLRQARALLARESFDLVLLDMILPDGHGPSLLPVTSGADSKPLPVMILSADEPPESVRAQVDAVVVKSRTSERFIVETILNLITPPHAGPQEPAHAE